MVSIGGMQLDEIAKRLKRYTSVENKYALRAQGKKSLIRDDFLGELGLLETDSFLQVLASFHGKRSGKWNKTIVLDIRKNEGGDGRVANAFFRYLPGDYRSMWGVLRNSEGLLNQNPIFSGDLYAKLALEYGIAFQDPLYSMSGQFIKAGGTMGPARN